MCIRDRNYYGGLRFDKSVIPYMQAQKRGKIIFTSSGVGVTGFIGISPYASTKGALESLAKCQMCIRDRLKNCPRSAFALRNGDWNLFVHTEELPQA